MNVQAAQPPGRSLASGRKPGPIWVHGKQGQHLRVRTLWLYAVQSQAKEVLNSRSLNDCSPVEWNILGGPTPTHLDRTA
jgi:hypothetical protein